jgi:hypothetical protein
LAQRQGTIVKDGLNEFFSILDRQSSWKESTLVSYPIGQSAA